MENPSTCATGEILLKPKLMHAAVESQLGSTESRHTAEASMGLGCRGRHLAAFAGSVGFPVDNKSMIWREIPWTSGGFKEYPWTLSSMKVSLLIPECLHESTHQAMHTDQWCVRY